MNLLLIFTFYIISQTSILNLLLTRLILMIFCIKLYITEISEWPKRQSSALNVMAVRDQRHANVSNQPTLLDDVDLPKWRVCGRGCNRSVHEGMNDISNVKVHSTTAVEM